MNDSIDDLCLLPRLTRFWTWGRLTKFPIAAPLTLSLAGFFFFFCLGGRFRRSLWTTAGPKGLNATVHYYYPPPRFAQPRLPRSSGRRKSPTVRLRTRTRQHSGLTPCTLQLSISSRKLFRPFGICGLPSLHSTRPLQRLHPIISLLYSFFPGSLLFGQTLCGLIPLIIRRFRFRDPLNEQAKGDPHYGVLLPHDFRFFSPSLFVGQQGPALPQQISGFSVWLASSSVHRCLPYWKPLFVSQL